MGRSSETRGNNTDRNAKKVPRGNHSSEGIYAEFDPKYHAMFEERKRDNAIEIELVENLKGHKEGDVDKE